MPFGTSPGAPDWNTIGALSLLFGLGYYIAMAFLDRSGRPGLGTPFAVSGFLATVGGIAAFTPHTHTLGTGVLLIVFGAVLAWVGARSARRFTTWAWAFAIGAGFVALIGDALNDNNAAAGILLIFVGAVLVGVAAFYTSAMREPLDDPLQTPAPLH